MKRNLLPLLLVCGFILTVGAGCESNSDYTDNNSLSSSDFRANNSTAIQPQNSFQSSMGNGGAESESSNINPPSVCTDFEYSEWSTCASDNTQSRTINKMLPEGCAGGNPVQFQKCDYKFLPASVTFQDIYKKMIDKIKNAPNKAINTSYIGGADGINTTELTWQINNDGLYLYVKGYQTSNPTNQSSMIMVDADFDGQPDWISNQGQAFVAISKSDKYYKEIILSWATFNSYFVSYLLK